MKSILSISAIILFSLSGINIKAQKISNTNKMSHDTISLQVLDNAKYRIFYSLSFCEDTTHPESRTESQTILLVGDKYSAFLDYNSLRKDSLYNALILAGNEGASAIAQTIAIGRLVKFKPTIIKNYPEKNNFTFQEMITSRRNYRYTDDQIAIQWQLSSEEKQFGKYTCKKATCTYRGRNYTAWYSPDITLGEGPYVFTGLPGLIFELYDDKQHYIFSLNGLEQARGYDPIYLPADNIINSTRKEVRKITHNLKTNPASILQMMGNRVQVNEEMVKKNRSRPYNPIELE